MPISSSAAGEACRCGADDGEPRRGLVAWCPVSNRLAAETSPYLLQHAGNPVDWYPWGDDAFAAARAQNKPVLLSIGYSACHWCHVMAHESFENTETAHLMNELFINIKVDREERPDVDTIYMRAVQMIAGHGGWPMTVFLTPDGTPYFGGTYFPPEDRHGLSGFPTILRAAADAYRTKPSDVADVAEQMRAKLVVPALHGGEDPTDPMLDVATQQLLTQVDWQNGGFGHAPKFPQPAALDFLLRRFHRSGDAQPLEAVLVSLDAMARGGLYDHVGGGFHRYTVDGEWTVPHFEKMLYDNAQLVPVYLHAFQLSGQDRWRTVVEDTLDYVAREMRLSAGGFASSQDADAEGVEGGFFVWTRHQLRDVLGDDASFAAEMYGVTDSGNFDDGATVLSRPRSGRSMLEEPANADRLASVRARMLEARLTRAVPGRDDKVLTSWNAMMLGAFAEAGAALERSDYVDIARAAADFLLTDLMSDGRVLRTWRDGNAKIHGFLEDVGHLANALLTLYEATGTTGYFVHARELAELAIADYADPQGGFSDTAASEVPLIVRPHSIEDLPLPTGQSVLALVCLRLHAFTAKQHWHDTALGILRPLLRAVEGTPLAVAALAIAADFATAPVREIAIVGDATATATRELIGTVWSRFDPHRVLAWGDGAGTVPLLEQRGLRDGRATAYVCQDFVCNVPVTDPGELRRQLAGTVGAAS